MQFKRLSGPQKKALKWQARRNALVCKMLDKDPWLDRREALRLANAEMARKDEQRKERARAKRQQANPQPLPGKGRRGGKASGVVDQTPNNNGGEPCRT